MSTGCQLHVEVVDGLIVARIVGEPTIAFFDECIYRLQPVLQDTGITKILYDLSAAEAPCIDTILHGTKISIEARATMLRRAIVAPNSKIAYLVRLVFGEENYRIFYENRDDAIQWLKAQG